MDTVTGPQFVIVHLCIFFQLLSVHPGKIVFGALGIKHTANNLYLKVKPFVGICIFSSDIEYSLFFIGQGFRKIKGIEYTDIGKFARYAWPYWGSDPAKPLLLNSNQFKKGDFLLLEYTFWGQKVGFKGSGCWVVLKAVGV